MAERAGDEAAEVADVVPFSGFYDGVGRVAVEGAQLEDRLLSLLLSLTGYNDAFWRYAYGQDLNRLIDMCDVALKTSPARLISDCNAQVEGVLARARSLKDRRNAVIHARWTPRDRAEDPLSGWKPRRSRPFEDAPVGIESVEQLRELAAELHVLNLDIFVAAWDVTHRQMGEKPSERAPHVFTPHGGTPDGRGVGPAEAQRLTTDKDSQLEQQA